MLLGYLDGTKGYRCLLYGYRSQMPCNRKATVSIIASKTPICAKCLAKVDLTPGSGTLGDKFGPQISKFA